MLNKLIQILSEEDRQSEEDIKLTACLWSASRPNKNDPDLEIPDFRARHQLRDAA